MIAAYRLVFDYPSYITHYANLPFYDSNRPKKKGKRTRWK